MPKLSENAANEMRQKIVELRASYTFWDFIGPGKSIMFWWNFNKALNELERILDEDQQS